MGDIHQQQRAQHELANARLTEELINRGRNEYYRGMGYGNAQFPIPAAAPAAGAPVPPPNIPMPAARTPSSHLPPYQAARAAQAAVPAVPAQAAVPAVGVAGQPGYQAARAAVPAVPGVPYQAGTPPIQSFLDRAQALSSITGVNTSYPYRETYKKGTELARDAAGKSFVSLNPQERERYINPHTRFVADEVARLGRQRLAEDILPALEHKFVRAGQHGGSAHRELMARAQRDMEREIGSQQRLALGQAYESGAKLYNEELMRNLLSSEMLGKMGIAQQQAESKDIETNTAAHNRARMEEESQRNSADARAEEERLWPMKMLQFWSDIMHGHPTGHTTTTTMNRNNPHHRGGMENIAQILQFLPALQGMFGGNAGFNNPWAQRARGGSVYAKGGSVNELHKEAENVRAHHGPGDTILAHINPSELAFLEKHFGGSINPQTGLPQFGFWGDLMGGISKYVLPIAAPIIGGVVGGPAGIGIGSTIGSVGSQLTGQLGEYLNAPDVSPEEQAAQHAQQMQHYQQIQHDPYAAANPTMGSGQLRALAQQLGQHNMPSNDYQTGMPVDDYQMGVPYYAHGGY